MATNCSNPEHSSFWWPSSISAFIYIRFLRELFVSPLSWSVLPWIAAASSKAHLSTGWHISQSEQFEKFEQSKTWFGFQTSIIDLLQLRSQGSHRSEGIESGRNEAQNNPNFEIFKNAGFIESVALQEPAKHHSRFWRSITKDLKAWNA